MEHSLHSVSPKALKKDVRETIELELSGPQTAGLAEAASPMISRTAPPAKGGATQSLASRKIVKTFTGVAALGFALLGGVAFLMAKPLGLMPSTVVSGEPLPAIDMSAQAEPTRFTNPFDSEEVFEFPAGTTESTARDAVAKILLQRAQERQAVSVDSQKTKKKAAELNSLLAKRN